MQTALANRLIDAPAFAGATVSDVAPCVDRDGARAIGVNVEARGREDHLSRNVMRPFDKS